MSIITIPSPQTKNLTQLNTSDVLGSIFSSQNLDIQENAGRMRVGKRMIVNSADTDSGLSDLYNPIAFVTHNNVIYTAGGASAGKVYKNGSTSLFSNFTADLSSNAPTDMVSDYSDIINASNGNMYATGSGSLYECKDGVWQALPQLLSTGVHMLTDYASRLYVSTLSNKIYSASIATGTVGTLIGTGSYTLNVGGLDSAANTITFMKASASRIWIGTVNTKGGKGYVYEWDGQSTIATRSYRLESSGALSCVIKDEIPYIVDANGDLLAFNGGTFVKLTGFNRENGYRLRNSTNSLNKRFIHPNGMSVIQGNVHLLINNMNDDYYIGGGIGSIENTIPSGVYEYTQSNGLVHKYGLGLSTAGGTIIDYGQNRISRAGALQELIRRSTDLASTSNGSFLAGGAIYTDATTTAKAMIWNDDLNDTLQKASTIVTPFIESSQVEDTFQKIFIKHKRLLNSTDKIVVKCRNVDIASVEATITWTSTTTFTVLNSDVVVSNYWTSDTGGEVEITQGLGSGKSAHITNAVLATGTWTVTVDETFTSATGTSKARFTNWTKLGTIENQVQQFQEFPISADNNSIYIQFKVWFLATGKNEIHSLNIISKTHQSLV